MDCLVNLVMFWSLLDPEVLVHISKLGDDSWRTREAATNALVLMDERPIRLLQMTIRNNSCPETRHRAERIIERQYNMLRPSNKDAEMPWIECLPKNQPNRGDVLDRATKDYGEVTYEDLPDITKCRWATHDFARRLYDQGHSRKQVIEILDKMVANEKQWHGYGGRSCLLGPPEFDK